MSNYDGFTQSLAAQWVEQELVSRQAQPASNPFETGRLDAILTVVRLFGAEHFDSPTQTAVSTLASQPQTYKLLNWLFEVVISSLSEKLTDLSEEELGYLHALVGCVRLFNFIGVPEKVDQTAAKLAESPQLQAFEKRFDWATRKLNS